MIIDDLYIAIRDRLLLAPSLGIATIDWNNGQPDQWESGEGKMDPLKLPCVLVRYEPPNWQPRGRKHYEAEGIIYLDIVQRNVDEPFASDRRNAKVQKRRDSYAIVQAIGKRLVGMRGVGYGTFGLIGMDQDHDYAKLRVDTIAFRSLLCTDMDPETWTLHEVPDLVIDTNPPMLVPSNAIIVVNSDASYTSGVLPPGTYVLPNVTHTDSDGSPRVLPGMVPMVCTPGSGSGEPGTAILQDTDGNILGTTPVPSGEIVPIIAPDATVEVQNSVGGVLHEQRPVLSGGSIMLIAQDAEVQMVDTDANPIGAIVPAPAGNHLEILAPDATVTNNPVAPTYTEGVLSGGELVLPKVRVQRYDGSFVDYDYVPRPTITHVEVPPSYIMHEYTAGATWSKPSGLRGVWVLGYGAGGGGGAGVVAAGGNGTGGGGGGGGARVWMWIPASALGATETITIGAGGAGGTTTAGSAGGDTSFGSIVIAKGGLGGAVGSTASGTVSGGPGGQPVSCVPSLGPFALIGGSGGSGVRQLNQSPGTNGENGAAAGPGGGGGGGLLSSAPCAGYAGGGCYHGGSLTSGGAAGASGGGNGGAGVNDVNLDMVFGLMSPTIGVGTAGGGGGGINGANGGNGGNGGRAAGGGGGGTCNSGTRGAGGSGGNGFLILVEVY